MATQKRYNRQDQTLKFVDGNDELDFLCEEFPPPNAAMSCGHAVTPMSLTKYCLWLLKEKDEYKFTCPVTKKETGKPCNSEWPYTEVRKMALLTVSEKRDFELTMADNAAEKQKNNDKRTCPACSSCVVRKNPSNLCVRCTVCTSTRKKPYEFCWQCMKEWVGPITASELCGNNGCVNPGLDILRKCSEITFEMVKGVTGCPSIRACPTCGLRIQHDTTGCKNITCTRCKAEFCFVCLKITSECRKLKPDYFGPCSSGVAPRQTSIPGMCREGGNRCLSTHSPLPSPSGDDGELYSNLLYFILFIFISMLIALFLH